MVAQVWTKEACLLAARDFEARTDFLKALPGAYSAAHRNGWLDEVCQHMPRRISGRPWKWSDENIASVTSSYMEFTDFRVEQSRLFAVLCQSGRVEEFCGHMRRTRNANNYWTKDRCALVAQECATRSDLMKRFSAAYDAAHKNGWLDDICAHMERIGNHKRRAVYIIKALGERKVYVGISAYPRRRYGHHLTRPMPHLRDLISSPHRFRVISKYIDLNSALGLETRLAKHFERKGYEVCNKSSGGQAGPGPKKWTRKALVDLAAALETRGQMMREHLGAYDAAYRSGLLGEIFKNHHNRGFGDGPVRDWDLERLQETAARCDSKTEFKRLHPKAWEAARRRGLLDDLFADKPNGGKSYELWTKEKIIERAKPYSSGAQFREGDYRAWRAASRRKLLSELFASHTGD